MKMELHAQSVDIVDYKDIVNVEVIQHEKVQLVFETLLGDGPIKAELSVSGCEDVRQCTQLSHTILHTDRQSFLSISVHPHERDFRYILVSWLLGFIAILLLLFWIFRIWVRRRDKNRRVPNDTNGHLTIFSSNAQKDQRDGNDSPFHKVVVNGCHGNDASPGLQPYSNLDLAGPNQDDCDEKLKATQMADTAYKHSSGPQINIQNGHLTNGHCKLATDHSTIMSSLPFRPVMSSSMADRLTNKITGPLSWWYYLISTIVVVSFGVVLLSGSSKFGRSSLMSTLKVTIPSSTHVRHIRSYSEDPDIRSVSMQPSASSALVTRLQLLDLSLGCRSNLSNCRTHALCEATNLEQGVKCRCNRGFYLKDLTCTPCRTSCDRGFYMTKQCSAEEDVVCRPCSSCGEMSYEVAACTSTQDTLCIDVTFPLKQFQSRMASIEDLISLNVTMSRNVFLERLNNIKKLEMPLYVTNNRQQQFAFFWDRESGLEIEMKIADIYLIPEYVDIDHTDDRAFILDHAEYPENITKNLWAVMQNYCRHPIPDMYDLQLEISKQKTTLAREMTCNSEDRNRPSCPEGYKDGDKYLYKNVAYPCNKISSNRRGLFKATKNNVLCDGNTDLLNTIFRKKVKETEYLKFPSPQCKDYESQCSRCLSQKACVYGSNQTDCCNLGCQSETACKNYYSNTCPPSPVECLKGDITKFSILPRYPSIPFQFVCHLRQELPKHLFVVTYEAKIPSMQFSFGTRTTAIKAKTKSEYYQGFNKVDYLEIMHLSDSKFNEEVFLAGTFKRGWNASVKVPEVEEYTLHKVKQSWEFDRSFQRYNVTQPSANGYRAQIQFEKPFLYSVMNWYQGGCDKNVTQIVPYQPLYELFGVPVMQPDKNKLGDKFLYQLLTVNSNPHIRLAVPKDSSILSHYKNELGSARLYPGSLAGTIMWDKTGRYWNITITGATSLCPGLFTLELFSENTETKLAIYDMLVNCPQNFSIMFKLQRNSVMFSDVFIAVFNDTVSSYRIVLSSIQGPSFFHSNDNNVKAAYVPEGSPWLTIFVILSLCIIVSASLLCIYVFCDKQKVKHLPMDLNLPKPDLGPEITLLQDINQVNKKKEGMNFQTRFIMTSLVILYIVYAFLFTFTALFSLLHVLQGSSMHSITLVTDTSEKIQTNMKTRLEEMVNFENNETQRLLSKTQERLYACNNHLKTMLSDQIPDLNSALQKKLATIFPNDGSLEQMLHMYFKKQQNAYDDKMSNFMDEFNKTLELTLKKLQFTYASYLNDIAQNRWFSFPRELFIDQLKQERPWAATLDIPDNLADFLTWLEVDKVKEVTEVRELLMNKMIDVLPKLDYLSILNKSSDLRTAHIPRNITDTEFKFKFSSGLPPGYHGFKMYQLKGIKRGTMYPNTANKTGKSGKTIASFRGIMYPFFIALFVVLDVLLLCYRLFWLKSSIHTFKSGIEQRVPYDRITRKIYFILTGKDINRPEDSLDHPYDYYMNNKEDIWGENTELYFLYCQASQKSKEEILRDLWSHKQRQKPKVEPKVEGKKTFADTYGFPFLKYLYRLFISPIYGRLVMIGGFVLLVCLIAKAIDDLVTMESAVFLMDTDSLMPILARQSQVTNSVISAYGDYLNNFLSSFKRVLDSEVQTLNTMLVHVAERQSTLLNSLISDLCNLAGQEDCGEALNLVTMALISCNFLPLQTRPYTGFHENILTEFVKSELSPLVLNLRSILFSTLYLLLTFAAAMTICQILARVIFVHLCKSRHMKTVKIFQLPGTDNYEQQSFREKEMYDGHSVIAESCESGVYDLTS